MTSESGTERRIALVGCGAAKMVTAGPVPARDLYTSTYFAKKREFAQEHCHNWRILSAEHGAPCPGREIETYERHIDDVDVDSWARRARLHLWKYKRDYELVVLAGQKYIEPIRGWLDEIDSTVRYPFGETSGIGEQLSVLNSLIEDPNLGSPEDQREDSDGGRDDESTEQVTLGEVADD